MVKAYLGQISSKAFRGETLINLEGSLYQAGADQIIIVASAPSTEHYFFGLNSTFIEKTKWVVFGCRNDRCIFKVPSSLLVTLNFSQDRMSGRKILTVYFDHTDHNWYLVSKKQIDNPGHVINISRFMIDLRDEDDIMAESVYLRQALGI